MIVCSLGSQQCWLQEDGSACPVETKPCGALSWCEDFFVWVGNERALFESEQDMEIAITLTKGM